VERRPHVREVIQRVIAFGSVIQTTSRLQAWVRDRVLLLQSAMGRSMAPKDDIVPPLTDGLLAAARPGKKQRSRGKMAALVRGYQFLQRPVTLPDGSVVPLDDALGLDFALVAYDCNPRDALDPETLERFTQLGGRLVHIAPAQTSAESAPPGTVRDHTGALQEWFAAHAMQVALVRPDRYVFGGGPVTDSPALMQQLLTFADGASISARG